MGLDGVEIVMYTEERFGMRLPDAEVNAVRTVRELACVVFDRLPRTASGACSSASAFYELRRDIRSFRRIEKHAICPSTRFDDLVPEPDRRRRFASQLNARRERPAIGVSMGLFTAVRFLPEGLTIGQAARRSGSVVRASDGSTDEQVLRAVIDEVRGITAEQMALDIEEVHPDSRFVEDLGVD